MYVGSLLTVGAVCVSVALAFNTGAPCAVLDSKNLKPDHGFEPQPLRFTPYYIELRNTTSSVKEVIAGEAYKVIIHGHPMGFLLRTVDEKGDDVGQFLNNECAKVVGCEKGRYITHTKTPCSPLVQFYWSAPEDATSVNFMLTAVKAYNIYWTGIFAHYPVRHEDSGEMSGSFSAVCRKDGNKSFCERVRRRDKTKFCKKFGYYCTMTCCDIPS